MNPLGRIHPTLKWMLPSQSHIYVVCAAPVMLSSTAQAPHDPSKPLPLNVMHPTGFTVIQMDWTVASCLQAQFIHVLRSANGLADNLESRVGCGCIPYLFLYIYSCYLSEKNGLDR